MRVLITGGAGFIGSHLVEHFHHHADVRVLDNLRTGHRDNLQGLRHEFFEGSILDRDLVRRAMDGVEYVFHLAAMVSVPESMQRPIECNDINTTGTLIVLEEAARARVRRLVFSSSAAVYGDNAVVPKHESMVPEPKSPYAITKLDGEFYCALFQREGWLSTVCLRYFNVFGPRQDPKSPYAAAVPIFIARALRHEPLTIFGGGTQTRDFIHVRDVVAANVHMARHPSAAGVYNVAYGKQLTVRELAEQIIRLTNSRSTIQLAPERPGDVKHSMASIQRLLATGFEPRSSLGVGLQQTIDYFRARIENVGAPCRT